MENLFQDIQTKEGLFRVFHSLSYGDIVIIFLFVVSIALFSLKWIYEVNREGDW